MTTTSESVVDLAVLEATPETVAPFGVLITDDVEPDLDIPYYRGRVIEGGDIGFRYRGQASLRTAKVLPDRAARVEWLERHLSLTQLFVGLGTSPFVMVLAPPNHATGGTLPDLAAASALMFPGGSALMLHLGTWHDFPIAVDAPVALLIGNSQEVVDILHAAGRPRELDDGDVFKVSLPDRFGVTLLPRW
jgi:ureidoglycolate lyase